MIGSVQDWSDSRGLKDGAYVLNLFEDRFVRLKPLVH